MTIENYPYTTDQIAHRLQSINLRPAPMSEQEMYRFILGSIDLTTLEGTDNDQVVKELCQKALDFQEQKSCMPAAVCVYPPFVKTAAAMLRDKPITVASVAGAFPAGQSPIAVKVAEVRYAVEQGADEIDMVISRGTFLQGDYQTVYDEIKAIKDACKHAKLKVILETGELKTPQNIFKASQIAIAAGADFIKTSTGKIAVNATPEAFLVMMDAIKFHHQQTGKQVGIKAAGGISDPDTAVYYVKLLHNVLGNAWMNRNMFRIGASRLATKVAEKIR
ncbi:MAG: deoxyribose-phosphate aldolase [Bacteroidales bacterium]|nr:deoxyribose-phosphate aldolase [Bacteroidales bacterium]MBO7646544.1 deoxyribose-phosphate aldolase [Bacteroidales bacterium]